MATLLKTALTNDRLLPVLRQCPRCGIVTPHEINAGLVVCLLCIERARTNELDVDEEDRFRGQLRRGLPEEAVPD